MSLYGLYLRNPSTDSILFHMERGRGAYFLFFFNIKILNIFNSPFAYGKTIYWSCVAEGYSFLLLSSFLKIQIQNSTDSIPHLYIEKNIYWGCATEGYSFIIIILFFEIEKKEKTLKK